MGGKNPYTIISLYAEKAFDKIQHRFMIKVLERAGIQGPYLNIIKTIYRKPIANITLSLFADDMIVYLRDLINFYQGTPKADKHL